MEKSYEKYLDDAVKKIQEGMGVLAAKTDELTQKGKVKFDILSIKREIDKNLTELGREIFDLKVVQKAEKPLDDTQVTNLFETIKSLKEKLKVKEADYESISPKENEKETEESDHEAV